MRKILILAIKGGVGKSTICAGLGLALKRLGYMVGFLDVDVSGANLPLALGMSEPFPRPRVEVSKGKMYPVFHDGFEIFSLAFRFGTSALLWKEETIDAFGEKHKFGGSYELVRFMLSNVEFGKLDFLLCDLPPGSGEVTLSLIENIGEIYGAILVSQPTSLSFEDLRRALNMIEIKRVPLIGIVENMLGVVCPHCSNSFQPFLDTFSIEKFSEKEGIPYLLSIPLTPNREILRDKFDKLAILVLERKPVKIWEKGLKEELELKIKRGIIKGLFK